MPTNDYCGIFYFSKKIFSIVISSESSLNGSLFLKKCVKEFPFEIENIQTDNGSTFQKYFDELC